MSLMCFVLFYACFARRNPVARLQFLLAFVLAWVLGALFDPLALDDQGTQRITNWGGVDCLLWLVVSLVPVAAWRLKVFCDRYV